MVAPPDVIYQLPDKQRKSRRNGRSPRAGVQTSAVLHDLTRRLGVGAKGAKIFGFDLDLRFLDFGLLGDH